MQQKTQRDPDGNEKGEAPTPISSGAETLRTQPERESPSSGDSLMEAILNPENLKQALKRVKANKGAPGVDEMSVSELPEHLKRQWELLSNVVYGVGQAAFLSDSSSTWTPSLNFTLFTTNVSSTNPLSRFHFFCAASSSL